MQLGYVANIPRTLKIGRDNLKKIIIALQPYKKLVKIYLFQLLSLRPRKIKSIKLQIDAYVLKLYLLGTKACSSKAKDEFYFQHALKSDLRLLKTTQKLTNFTLLNKNLKSQNEKEVFFNSCIWAILDSNMKKIDCAK